MFRKLAIALLVAGLSMGPAFAVEQVTIKQAPKTQAATEAQQSQKAVVDKGVSSATITVPPSSEAQEIHLDIKPLIDGLMPYIVSALGVLITTFAGAVCLWLKQKFNIDIEAKQREAWQQTATNAAGDLLAKGAVSIEQMSGRITVHDAAMTEVINTAISRVPQAIKALNLTPEQMAQTITAKVPQVLGGLATPPAKG